MKGLVKKLNRLQSRAIAGICDFYNSEKGDTNFISIIIIIAIVIALAGIFYTFATGGMNTISKAFTDALKKWGVK